MDVTERFAEFLAKEAPSDPDSLDRLICSYLSPFRAGSWGISQERLRLAAKFVEIADNIASKTLILDRIENAPFKTSSISAT
ncbi:MAG TPA: hypothetical protein VMB84_02895 [Stellaceae bacterium]|nr:hypothetical protein [Stellaceae bacterium]